MAKVESDIWWRLIQAAVYKYNRRGHGRAASVWDASPTTRRRARRAEQLARNARSVGLPLDTITLFGIAPLPANHPGCQRPDDASLRIAPGSLFRRGDGQDLPGITPALRADTEPIPSGTVSIGIPDCAAGSPPVYDRTYVRPHFFNSQQCIRLGIYNDLAFLRFARSCRAAGPVMKKEAY